MNKIIKVIVDELPESCCMCPLMGNDSKLGYCLSGEELESDYCDARPDWCPLVAGEIIPTLQKGCYLLIEKPK